jgi:hypothetical protein
MIGPLTALVKLLLPDLGKPSNVLREISQGNIAKFDVREHKEVQNSAHSSPSIVNAVSAEGLRQLIDKRQDYLPSSLRKILERLTGFEKEPLSILCADLVTAADRPYQAGAAMNLAAHLLANIQPKDAKSPLLQDSTSELLFQVGKQVLQPVMEPFAKKQKVEHKQGPNLRHFHTYQSCVPAFFFTENVQAFDGASYQQAAPRPVVGFMRSLFPAAKTFDSLVDLEKAAELEKGSKEYRFINNAIDLCAAAAMESFQPPMVRLTLQAVYRITSSYTAVHMLSKMLPGGSLSATVRHPASASGTGNSGLFPELSSFKEPFAIAFDNAGDYDRYHTASRLGQSKNFHAVCLAPIFTLTQFSDLELKTQQTPLNLKQFHKAPLDCLLPTVEETKRIAQTLKSEMDRVLASCLLHLAPSQISATQKVCTCRDCKSTELLAATKKSCPSCGRNDFQRVADLLDHPLTDEIQEQQQQSIPNKIPVPQTHQVHPQDILHESQTLKGQENFLRAALEELGIIGDKAKRMVAWIMLVGDGKTTEFFQKVSEDNGWEPHCVFIMGLLHEFMLLQKATMAIMIELGGEDLVAAVGWKSAAQIKLVWLAYCFLSHFISAA